VVLAVDESLVDPEDRPLAMGYVTPELHFYRSLTAMENLEFLLKLRRLDNSKVVAASTLDRVGLGRRGNDPVGSFSSGMVQRLRLAAATMHDPRILLLDEPFSNLDSAGADMVRATIDRHLESGGVMMLATNNSEEASLCKSDLCVSDYPD
jgi:ABC-type multidrug transport system ATPase subunit